MNLGENIYRLRTKKHMSQGDLADALNVSRQSVSKWENNSAVPELEKLIKMSELFEVSLDELVGKEPPVKEVPEPAPNPVPAPVTTADLVSILILLFGILIPVIILATNHNSLFLMILGLFVIPPLATICAALCTPKNKILFGVFLVYCIVFGILASIAGNVLAPLIAVVYLFAIGFWNDRLE